MNTQCTYRPFLRFFATTEDLARGGSGADESKSKSDESDSTDAGSENDGTEANKTDEPDEKLGEAGTKALEAMKVRAREAERKQREADAKIAALEAAAAGKAKEHEDALAAQKVKDEAIAAANTRILKAEVRALAAGKLSDPEDALRFLELEDFDVTETGDVDRAAITAAIEQLITSKPYLAAQGGGRFQGAGDGGARNAQKPQQISDAELAQMAPEQINKARREGRLDRLLGKTA